MTDSESRQAEHTAVPSVLESVDPSSIQAKDTSPLIARQIPQVLPFKFKIIEQYDPQAVDDPLPNIEQFWSSGVGVQRVIQTHAATSEHPVAHQLVHAHPLAEPVIQTYPASHQVVHDHPIDNAAVQDPTHPSDLVDNRLYESNYSNKRRPGMG